jgi:hypothetical protein
MDKVAEVCDFWSFGDLKRSLRAFFLFAKGRGYAYRF